MIRTYYPSDKNKLIGKYSTVGKFYMNYALAYIKLDDKIVEAVELMEQHFGAVFSSQSIHSVYALYGSGTHSKDSYHYKGKAIDIALKRPDGTFVDPVEMARFAETIPYLKGIGVYKPVNKHIHIDTRASKYYWYLVTSKSNTPSFGGMPCTYKLGHRSPFVMDIQTRLANKGIYKGKITGVYDAATKQAVYDFQKLAYPSNKKEWDGACGKNTQAKLFAK